jgi:hypothetical protein
MAVPFKSLEDRKRCNALSRRRRVAATRLKIVSLLGEACCKCGFSDLRALAIDHKNGGGTKEREVGGGYYAMVLRKVESGSGDYQLLCFNCNQIKKHENGEERFRVHE